MYNAQFQMLIYLYRIFMNVNLHNCSLGRSRALSDQETWRRFVFLNRRTHDCTRTRYVDRTLSRKPQRLYTQTGNSMQRRTTPAQYSNTRQNQSTPQVCFFIINHHCKIKTLSFVSNLYLSTFLFHPIFRATKAGELKVVHELLACGYQSRDAKNHYGQTAVHLASIAGNDDILSEFISREMSVHCRDTAGFTPLHVSGIDSLCYHQFVHYFYVLFHFQYACQKNRPSTIKLLVLEGGANVQTRHAQTGKVPLHEAAQFGNIDCIKVRYLIFKVYILKFVLL